MPRQIAIGLMLMLFVSGCGRKAVHYKYYIIEAAVFPDSIAVNTSPAFNYSCEILPVDIQPAFASDRIAVRTHTHELSYYAYHKWAVPPGETLTKISENYLQRQRIFSSAATRVWKLVPDFRLQTRIYQLEALQSNKKERLTAHLNIEFALIDNASRQVVVFHSVNRQKPLTQNDLNLFAAEISQMYNVELQQFSEKIISYLKSIAPKVSEK